jgi:hypothetical protein
MVPVSIDVQEGRLGRNPPIATLVFRALKPSDPDIKRPGIEAPTLENGLTIFTIKNAMTKINIIFELRRVNILMMPDKTSLSLLPLHGIAPHASAMCSR